MLGKIIGLIAPHYCVCCGYEGKLLCRRCWQDLPPPRACCYKCRRPSMAGLLCGVCQTSLDGVTAVTNYQGVAKLLVAKLKYGRAAAAAEVIAEVMAAKIGNTGNAAVTFVPTADNRVRVRGYDQAQLIARRFACLTASPSPALLLRVGSERQVGQSKLVRRRQLVGAFRLSRDAEIKGRHIVLIDDVITTGSTLEVAAATLKRGGAASVRAVVFAAA